MKLDFESIKKITVGSVDTWQEEDGVHFSKCTKEQRKIWETVDPLRSNAAKATTGIRLDFYTDSTFLNVETSAGGKFEVIADDVCCRRFVKNENEVLKFSIDLKNRDRKHVVIVLPSHSTGVIRSIAIDDSAKIERRRFDKKILFLGDSITQGWDSFFDSGSYAYLVGERLNAESVIQGIGGACFEPETVVDIGFDADTVFVAYGTNDFDRRNSISEIKRIADEFLKRLKSIYKKAEIFVVSPVWRQDIENPRKCGSFEECCRAIKSAANENGARIIDGDELLPHRSDMFADDVHPNDFGFAEYAFRLVKAMND